MLFKNTLASFALLAGFAAAHPGHDVAQEAAERRAYLQSVKRTSLSHCTDKLRARGIEARNIARRNAVIEKARQKRGLTKRNFDKVINTNHNKTELGYTRDTDPVTLFAGYNSCLLTPETTEGPYYVAGEFVRENIVEDQAGVPLLLDYQVVDVNTCEPIPDVYVEIWHCNATGVYGGVVAPGNGNSNDRSNLDATWLRGILPTNEDGVAQFESIFPGHYTGRTAHIHIAVHTNATLLPNNTLGHETYASHVGQAFFDQALIDEVEKLDPYTDNRQPLTTNVQDWIMRQAAGPDGVDPVMEYTLLGDTLEDGLFAWLAFGVDSKNVRKVQPAVLLGPDGGVPNGNAGGPPGGFPGGPGGPFPTGFPPGFPTNFPGFPGFPGQPTPTSTPAATETD
ncbi:hypothetical protein VTJ83DRAFT_4216 [Remersonia thermophila]|uniref:Intradiol ring-cleavage dioxygenases domain-containing protein n=1 Tax=Remersonia thermophila TaxID=72144 RepID=A0ABR4DBE5_9PEZI